MKARVWKDNRDGRYVVIVELGLDAEGKRRTKWERRFGSQEQALAYCTTRNYEALQGEFVEESDLTVAQWVEKWLSDYVVHAVEETTYTHYKQSMNAHIVKDLGDRKLQKLTPVVMQTYITSLVRTKGLAPSTVRYLMTANKKCFGQAVAVGLLKRNPATGVVLPKVKVKALRVLDEAEMGKMLKAVEGTNLYIPVLLGCTTGMRRGEVLGLKWDSITDNIATITEVIATGNIAKGPKNERSRRAVTLPPMVVAALKEHKRQQAEGKMAVRSTWRDTGYILTKVDGGPWGPNDISVAFHRVMKRLGFDGFRFHDLRHTHASQLIKAGVPISVVAQRLGHDPAVCLRIYSHLLPGMDADAANVMERALASK